MVLFFTGSLVYAVDFLGKLSYLGSLILGALYASALTGGFASVAFVAIGEKNNPLVVAILGGLGAMFADFLIFRFIKIGIISEIKLLFEGRFNLIRTQRIKNFVGLRLFRVPALLFGFLVIASPLPDELGIFILASLGVRIKRSAPLFFILNASGIYLLALVGAAIAQ